MGLIDQWMARCAVLFATVLVVIATPAPQSLTQKAANAPITDADIEAEYAKMAARMRVTPVQLTRALARGGLDPDTIKQRIRAHVEKRRQKDQIGGPN